jgi:predicted MFS family arabinose efflux permease
VAAAHKAGAALGAFLGGWLYDRTARTAGRSSAAAALVGAAVLSYALRDRGEPTAAEPQPAAV